jgi:hypothetical protein
VKRAALTATKGKEPTGPSSTNQVQSEQKSRHSTARQPARLPFVGFVASKKVCKSACERNRIKRRAREAYRLIRIKLHHLTEDSKDNLYDVMKSYQGWYALVWVLNEKALNAPWQEIYKKMEECLLEAARKFGWRGRKAENADLGR